jgi:hypothetical protein
MLLGAKRGKDERNQNTLAPVVRYTLHTLKYQRETLIKNLSTGRQSVRNAQPFLCGSVRTQNGLVCE